MNKAVSRVDFKALVAGFSKEQLEETAFISVSNTDLELAEMSLVTLAAYEENTAVLCFPDLDDGLSDGQAEYLVKFIHARRDMDFLIHCEMGVSRSQGIRQYISDYYDRDKMANDTRYYNRGVYRTLINKAQELFHGE